MDFQARRLTAFLMLAEALRNFFLCLQFLAVSLPIRIGGFDLSGSPGDPGIFQALCLAAFQAHLQKFELAPGVFCLAAQRFYQARLLGERRVSLAGAGEQLFLHLALLHDALQIAFQGMQALFAFFFLLQFGADFP